MTPVVPLVVDGPFRRLAWQNTRTEIYLRVFVLLGFAPGVAAGLWLTREWNWPGATTVVPTVLGLVSTLLLGCTVWAVRRLVRGPVPPREATRPADERFRAVLVRDEIDGEAAVVSPPTQENSLALLGVFTVLLTLAVPLAAAFGIDESQAVAVALVAAFVATGFVGPAGWLRGPAISLLADRVELRRCRGRRVIAWPDIAGAAVHRGRAVIYLRTPQAVVRKGRARRTRTNRIPVRDPSLKAGALVNAIEHYRTDEAARAEIRQPPQPQVVGHGHRLPSEA